MCFVTKTMPIRFYHWQVSYKATEKRKSRKTCLTNHTRSISHHITPLVINSDTRTHAHIPTREPKQFQETRCALAFGQRATLFNKNHATKLSLMNISQTTMCFLYIVKCFVYVFIHILGRHGAKYFGTCT